MRFRVILPVAATSCVVAIVLWRKEDIRRSLSSFTQTFSYAPAIEADVARDRFVETVFVAPKPVEGHTHATAAANRSAATTFCRKFAAYSGSRLFSLSMSRSDQRKGIPGERQWYWAKDVNAINANDVVEDRDLYYLCDVDYYKDMPRLLADAQRPVVLYTVVPEMAAGTGIDDTSFSFEEDGRLKTFVAGGGTYLHHLWDYGTDSLLVFKTVCGIPYRATVFAVERKQVAFSRQIILLTPIRVFTGIGAILASLLLEHKPLKRFNPIVHTDSGSFVRFRVHRKDGTYFTTARCGSHLCATIPAEIDEALSSVSRLGKTNIMLPTVLSWIGDDPEKRKQGAVLTEYFRAATGKKVPTVYPVEHAVRSYDYSVNNYNQDERPKLQAFMSPLFNGAFCPVANAAGERACVEGRINKLKRPEPKPTNFVDQCMMEFAELVVGNATLHPVEVGTVEEKQTRSAQKVSLDKAMVSGPYVKRLLKCFIKAEAYSDVKAPRNISTYNDKDKLTMAQFALALSAHCKRFLWYGPGKTPLEIAARVAQICQHADYVNQSDYHRMDGTITVYLRNVDRLIFMKAFGGYGPVLNELLKNNFDNNGILPHGTKFKQGASHGSGCSATSLSQTLRATFTAYLGFRHSRKPDGSYYGPQEAFSAIGIHFGDDGLDANLPPDSHKWAADRVGLILEAETVQHGQPGVTFLARNYSPEVWHGDLNSMCDVRRQLSKFHTTVRLPANVTAEEKLVEKARGYVATDRNTPVIGPLCKRAVALSGSCRRRNLGLGHWWSKFDESEQFPNENVEGWMDAEFLRIFPEFDRDIFDQWIIGVTSLSGILEAPLCVETKPATPTDLKVVVDGDVLPAKTSSTPAIPARSETNGRKSITPRSEKRGKRSRHKG